MEKVMSFGRKALAWLLSAMLVVGWGGVSLLATSPLPAVAASVDVGANPAPRVDIAVNIPADYPGTFAEFKEELAAKLIEQGMPASDFRITTTQVAIDTTDTSGWIVYDHYRDQATYNSLTSSLTPEQKAKQPYRGADNSHTNGTGTIESYFKNNTNTTGNKCKQFDRHIYSSQDDEGKASMVFAGYGTQALTDYMIYPAASNSRRTFSFDINPAVIDTHTLSTYGFFLNAGIAANGNINGYALIFSNSHVGSIQKINKAANANGMTGTAVLSNLNMGIKTGDKVRLSVELNKDSVTIQYQKYDSAGNLGTIKDLVRDFKLDETGFNGFGPVVNYSSHGCASLSIMKYSDLEMGYEASAFDALKNVQYYEGADWKYFVNLAGDSNDAGIPDEFNNKGEVNKSYRDGVNRMNENKIFYLSNDNDGQIVTDSTQLENGNNHQGLGSGNGYYAPGSNYIQMMAEYIYGNYRDGIYFQQAKVESDLPLANFFIKESGVIPERQIMTVHLEHLRNAVEQNKNLSAGERLPEKLAVNIFDKSLTGTLSGEDGHIAQWILTVTDPDNNPIPNYNKVTVDDPAKLPDFLFDKDSKRGRYTFTLEVVDDKGNKSRDFSTYITAFEDVEHPYIEGENTGRNLATITLTDTGEGIDEDGITFIEDGRGSGVAAYWVTNDVNATPEDSDWITLPFAQHSYAFDQKIESTEPLVVWVRDECGNVGNKAVFQPTHVRVEGPDGEEIDDYYVIGDKPIIVLPEDDEVPEPEDPENENFSGWVTGEEDDPVTPGTTPKPKDNEIIIRPSYSRDYAKLVYLPNGGTMEGDTTQSVISGSSIYKKVYDRDATPTRTGYSFQGWVLLKSGNEADAANEAYINNKANQETIAEQRALCEKTKTTNEAGEEVETITRDTYYLVALWQEGQYNLKFDANGGSLGKDKGLTDIKYATSFDTLVIPVTGRTIPTKPGYFFCGWSEKPGSNNDSIFKAATGYTKNAEVPTMPDHDKTIYAVWKADTTQFVVSFNSNGGSNITDQAYAMSSGATKYDAFMRPSRSGYTFAGWFEQQAIDEGGNITFGDTEYKGGEAFIKKANHTFAAKWTPRDDTKYNVQYYVSTGETNPDGTPNYKLVTGQTKTYTGTTEDPITMPEEDILDEITVDGQRCYLVPDSASNVYEGTITGDKPFALKLYYDRYLNVNADCNEGGSVTPALDQREGSSATVTWQPDEGYRVKRVTVDGIIRDDLKNATSVTIDGLHANHKVAVTYEPTTNEPTDEPANPEAKRFKVETAASGLTPNDLNLTPSYTLNEGADHAVTWVIPEGSTLASLIVDGSEVKASEYLKDDPRTKGVDYRIDFQNLAANHRVVINVTTEGLPKMGGSTTNGYKTITMNRYGGDSDCVLSSSAVGNPEDEPYTATWKPSDNYGIYKVVVDGKELSKADAEAMAKTLTFDKNHVVDVYFAKKKSSKPTPGTDPTDPKEPTDPTAPTDPADPKDPGTDPTDPTNPGTDPADPTDDPEELEEPDFSEMIRVTTKIEGHEGTITPSATVEKTGEDFVIDWSMNLREGDATVTGNLDDPNYGENTYKDYKIVDVTVNGDSTEDYVVLKDNGQLTLKDLREDADVVVKVESDMVDVKTDVMPAAAKAAVSKSISVYKGQNYVDIMSKANTGYKLVEVLVNGELLWNAAPEPVEPETPEEPQAPEATEDEPALDAQAGAMSVPSEDPTVEETDASTEESAEEVSEESVEEAVDVPSAVEEGVGGGVEFAAEEGVGQTRDKPGVDEDAPAADGPATELASTEGPEAVEDVPVPLSFRTYAAPNSGLNAEAYLPNEREEAAGDVEVQYIPEWEMMAQVRTASTTTAEVNVDADGHAHLRNIQDDQNVLFVYIAEDEKYEGPGEADKYRTVNLIMKDERGSSIPGQGELKTYEKGQPAQVSWKIPSGYELVSVNGDPNYKGSSKSFSALDNNEEVVVIVRQKDDKREAYTEPDNTPPSDNQKYKVVTGLQGGQGWISGAGDYKVGNNATVSWGVSDEEATTVYMVYVDGQPRPDLIAKGEVVIRDAKKGSERTVTVVLKTGDETPTNIDRNGDGVPDVNIDEDGDGVPDVNIDTDGDGEPDKNIKAPEDPSNPQADDPTDPSNNDGNGNNEGTTGSNGTDDGNTGTGNGASGQGGSSASGNGSGSGNDSGLGGAVTSVRLALAQTGDNLMPLLTLMGLVGTSGLALLGASALRRRAEEKEN